MGDQYDCGWLDTYSDNHLLHTLDEASDSRQHE